MHNVNLFDSVYSGKFILDGSERSQRTQPWIPAGTVVYKKPLEVQLDLCSSVTRSQTFTLDLLKLHLLSDSLLTVAWESLIAQQSDPGLIHLPAVWGTVTTLQAHNNNLICALLLLRPTVNSWLPTNSQLPAQHDAPDLPRRPHTQVLYLSTILMYLCFTWVFTFDATLYFHFTTFHVWKQFFCVCYFYWHIIHSNMYVAMKSIPKTSKSK